MARQETGSPTKRGRSSPLREWPGTPATSCHSHGMQSACQGFRFVFVFV